MRKVLNVGGNSKDIALPSQFAGWEHILLDIDPQVNPDVLCDARELLTLPNATYDAIYCSHNLEHYYHHDALKVLAGFAHVLKADGFAYIRVPDMAEVMRSAVERQLDIEDALYQSEAGPITVRDVMYGWGAEIERSGNDFFAHKTGFTEKSLISILTTSNFHWVYTGTGYFEIVAYAFINKPSTYAQNLLNIPDQEG